MFLIVDVFSPAWDMTSNEVELAFRSGGSLLGASADLALMFGGITVGLLGLVTYERAYMGKHPGPLLAH